MGDIARKLPQHRIRHLQGSNESTSKCLHSTEHPASSTENYTKIVKLPIKTEKEKEIKIPPSRVIQQPPKGIVIPRGALISPIVMLPNGKPPPMPPNADKATTSPSLGPDPNMDIEENSPHQEGIITETYVVPDQLYIE